MLAKRTKTYLTAWVFERPDREDARIENSAREIWITIWHSGDADLGDTRMYGRRVNRQTDVQLSRRTEGA